MKKKILSLLSTFAFALCSVALIAGVGLTTAGCSNANTITIGASVTPHALILKQLEPILNKKGYKLVIREFSDYVLPNTALQSGDIDANYFQHVPYLENFNSSNGTDLVAVAEVHYEPLGIYAGKASTLDALADGAKVGIPNDNTNGARALLLLEQEGIITLDPDAGTSATKFDIVENPKNLEIIEIEAAQLPLSLPDLEIAVINGNYALSADLKTAIAVEDATSVAAGYANVIAVKQGNENNEKINALIEALLEAELESFVKENFGASVVLKTGDLRK